MTRFADSSLQEITTPHLASDTVDTSQQESDSAITLLLGVLFFWFVAPFIAYLCMVLVIGVLLVSVNALQFFAVPLPIAVAVSLLVTAATVKVVFSAVTRRMPDEPTKPEQDRHADFDLR